MKLFVYIVLFFFSVYGFSKNRFALCLYIDDSDKAVGFRESFATEKDGNDIYIYYQADANLTQDYKVKIERMEDRADSVYTVLDEIILPVNKTPKNYTYKSYTFSLPGFYRFTLLDSNSNAIETYKTSIRYLDNYYANDSALDTWYYKNTAIVFCDSVLSEIFIGKKNKFPYNTGGTIVTTYITHDEKKLRTEKIVAKIYTIDGAKNLIETLNIDIKPTQRWTSFPVTLKNRGKYRVELYSDKGIFIQSKTVEIE
ncbi:MAG: hypothetical protein U0U67_11440 [Chitinophagales bacterium]